MNTVIVISVILSIFNAACSALEHQHVSKRSAKHARSWSEIAHATGALNDSQFTCSHMLQRGHPNHTGTDKIHEYHHYQHMYEELLEPIRFRPLRFLEIGLGCDMSYGPGASFKLWDEFFSHPETQLNYMEINGECVHKMNIRPRNGHVFIGSQDNVTFLEADVRQHLGARGGLDVLVDDGGHTMQQQLKTFATLWPIMRPGGLYIVEDVQTSYSEHHGGTADTHKRNDHTIGRPNTFMGHVIELLDVLNCDMSNEPCDNTLQAVYCYHHACAMRKAVQDAVTVQI